MSFYQTSYIFLQAAEKIFLNPYPAISFCPETAVSFLGLLHLKLLLIKEACTHYAPYSACADPENFVRGGPTLTGVFKLIRGGNIQIPL